MILASASFLGLDERDPARRDELDLISESVGRAAELTRRLLALGQRQPLQLVPVDANALLEDVVQMLRRVIPADVAIDLSLVKEIPLIRAEASQIEQVIMNLCLNARDAMPAGGMLAISSAAVTVSEDQVPAHARPGAGCYVRIVVTDTGAGMRPAVLDRMFEPFFTTKSEGRGTGLGLAVCRGITEQHGGFIRARSQESVGSTFEIYLPVAAGTVVAKPVATTASPTGHERILVADDQPHVRRVIERVLSQAGYSVVGVPDGKSAIEAAFADRFDLVILDAVMPEIGGRVAYERIRAAIPGIRVLFASGYGAEELTARFLADTAVPFLMKPFSPSTLLHAVRDSLDGR